MKKILSFLTIMVTFLIFGNVTEVKAFEVKTSDISNSTYVIGTNMFTRETSESYNGILSTNVIMKAAKTIESDELDDMIIYYKNARGVWVNALTNETIQIPEGVEIQYKNLKEFIVAPKLSTVASDGIGYSGFRNGLFIYELKIDYNTYILNEEENTYNAAGYEIYEKTDKGYTLVSSHLFTLGTAPSVEVEVGTSKTFVARVYSLNDSGEKVYSEYSNELKLDNSKVEAPKLTTYNPLEYGKAYAGFRNGLFIYMLLLDYDKYILNPDLNTYITEGYEIYEKTDKGYTLVSSHLFGTDPSSNVEVEVGTSKTFVARVYALNHSGEKVYSAYSNELKLDNSKVETPTLSISAGTDDYNYVGRENGEFLYHLGISGDYTLSDTAGTFIIEGYEIYEKTGKEYKLVTSALAGGAAEVKVEAGTSKTFVAKAYALNKSGEKVYSEYSNELKLDNSKVEAPSLNVGAGGVDDDGVEFALLSIDYEGYYKDKPKDIDGWTVYEKTTNGYTKLADIEGINTYEAKVNAGSKRIFVAKAYVLNKSGEKIYSAYSKEYILNSTN